MEQYGQQERGFLFFNLEFTCYFSLTNEHKANLINFARPHFLQFFLECKK